jgi:hypothetical protein
VSPMNAPFPRARHLEISLAPSGNAPITADDAAILEAKNSADALAKTEGSTAIFVDASQLGALPASQLTPAKIETAPLHLARAGEVPLGRARGADDSCLDEDGDRAGGAIPVLCPSAPRGRMEVLRAAAEAAARTDAVVLEGIDRWYAMAQTQGEQQRAGFCGHCDRALVEALRLSYGEQVEPFAPIELQKQSPLPKAQQPFAGMRHVTRLTEPLALVRAAALAARDAARKARGAEISVLARAQGLGPIALMSARHLDALVIALPSTDPFEALLPLLCARAAMGERAAIAELPAHAKPDEIRQLAALATACDTDVLLAPDASAEARAALLGHRKFAAQLREKFRPVVPLTDVDVLIAPLADHLSRGAHLRISSLATASLARAQLQLAVRLDEPVPVREGAKLLVLAGAEQLPDPLAPALRRHVETGGDLLLIGRCERVDDEGRALGPLFPEAKPGLERVGEGRVLLVIPPLTVPAPQDGTAPYDLAGLELLLQKAVRELLARTPRTLTISGRGQLWARAYLDPERKLDVHLVNLDLHDTGFVPAQGILLQIAGAAAGGGRTGYWFAHDRGGKEGERIALNPSGFSVSTVLPAVGASALLSVPR